MNNNELAVNTSIEDIYGDNPLITQLPPILDTKSVIKHLRGKLKFIPEQRFLPQPRQYSNTPISQQQSGFDQSTRLNETII